MRVGRVGHDESETARIGSELPDYVSADVRREDRVSLAEYDAPRSLERADGLAKSTEFPIVDSHFPRQRAGLFGRVGVIRHVVEDALMKFLRHGFTDSGK